MTTLPGTRRAQYDWLVVAIVAVVAFVYFTAGSRLLDWLSGSLDGWSVAELTVRLVLAVIVAAVLLITERRRVAPSIDAATRDGLVVAAIVIVTNNLFGTPDAGRELAVRTGMVLLGLPLLAVLTHLLSRRGHHGTVG